MNYYQNKAKTKPIFSIVASAKEDLSAIRVADFDFFTEIRSRITFKSLL
jgi:hypothetical protein